MTDPPTDPMTDPAAVQTGVARALGAPADVAESAVAALAAAGVLEHGVLFLAVLASARWGTDAVEALRRIAGGAEPPVSWSAYEERVAREEAREEAAGALARLGEDGGAQEVRAVLRACALRESG